MRYQGDLMRIVHPDLPVFYTKKNWPLIELLLN